VTWWERNKQKKKKKKKGGPPSGNKRSRDAGAHLTGFVGRQRGKAQNKPKKNSGSAKINRKKYQKHPSPGHEEKNALSLGPGSSVSVAAGGAQQKGVGGGGASMRRFLKREGPVPGKDQFFPAGLFGIELVMGSFVRPPDSAHAAIVVLGFHGVVGFFPGWRGLDGYNSDWGDFFFFLFGRWGGYIYLRPHGRGPQSGAARDKLLVPGKKKGVRQIFKRERFFLLDVKAAVRF